MSDSNPMHRLRSAAWAAWFCLRLNNPISLRKGSLYIPNRVLAMSDTKNGVTRIPLSKVKDWRLDQ